MPLAIALIFLVVGSLIFHFASPWYFTPLASNWGQIDFTINVTFWVTGIVFVATNLFMAYCIIKFRKGKTEKAEYEPENSRLEWILTVATTIGVAAMLAPGLFVWAKFVKVPDNAIEMEAVGQQWHWTYRYPGADGKFGNVDTSLITNENPLGMDSDDPHGDDDVMILTPEVYMPVNQPVKFNLRSKDVLHNFTVTQFRVKMDLVPGMETYLWLEAPHTGTYEVLCEELCGIGHHTMRGSVVVAEQDEFDNWLAEQPTWADLRTAVAGNADAGRAQYAVCAACHGQEGEGQANLNAPKLSGQGAWYMRRQIEAYQNGMRGVHEDDVFGKQMAPMANTLASAEAVNNVLAYIESLPDNPAPHTVSGDTDAGARIYRTCSYCHGSEGQGIQALNAPRLAGMTDWYTVTQLNNFKHGIRGEHPRDFYGMQMGFMGRILQDEQAINDLVAYINTL